MDSGNPTPKTPIMNDLHQMPPANKEPARHVVDLRIMRPYRRCSSLSSRNPFGSWHGTRSSPGHLLCSCGKHCTLRRPGCFVRVCIRTVLDSHCVHPRPGHCVCSMGHRKESGTREIAPHNHGIARRLAHPWGLPARSCLITLYVFVRSSTVPPLTSAPMTPHPTST